MVELNEQIEDKEKRIDEVKEEAKKKEEYLTKLKAWLSANIENKDVKKWLLEVFIPNYDVQVAALSKLSSKELINKLEHIKKKYSLLFRLSQTASIAKLHNSKNDLEFFEDSYDVLGPQEMQKLLDSDIAKFDRWFRYYISNLYSLFNKSGNRKLLREIAEAKETKRLLRYQDEIKFFKNLQAELSSPEEEKTWKGFLRLYKERKGRMRSIEEQFGDTKTAKKIEEELTKGGENRERFVKSLLPQMVSELQNQNTVFEIEKDALSKLREIIGKGRDFIRKLVSEFEKEVKKAFDDEINSIQTTTTRIESDDAELNKELVKHFEELDKLEVIENEIVGLFAKANEISKWRMKAITYISNTVQLDAAKWQNQQTLEQLKKYSSHMKRAVDMEESACKNIGTDIKAMMRLRGFIKTNERMKYKVASNLEKVQESAPKGAVPKK